jgi:hypothetical protein
MRAKRHGLHNPGHPMDLAMISYRFLRGMPYINLLGAPIQKSPHP